MWLLSFRYIADFLGEANNWKVAAVIVAGVGLLAWAIRFNAKALRDRARRNDAQLETAGALARSKLAEVGKQIPLADCSSDGRFSNGYSWHLKIESAASFSAKQVTVTVSWPAKRGVESMTVKATKVSAGHELS